MLTDRFRIEDLARSLEPAAAYQPFPTAQERASWEGIPDSVRSAAVGAGEKLLGTPWPALPATSYMEYARSGDREGYQRPYFQRRGALTTLALAECMESEGRFLDDIVNGVWAICDEASWVVPAHNTFSGEPDPLPDPFDPFIDLFAGDTGALLACVHYLLAPRIESVSPRAVRRLRAEVARRVLDQFLGHEDFWWMGRGDRWRLNNWTPWCTSTCLTAALLVEEDPDRRLEAVWKAMRILDLFLAGYRSDGGCDEGPGYWTFAGGALHDCLELLSSATDGAIAVYDEPLVQEIARYLHRVHIAGDWYANFADCNAKLSIPAGLVYRYGRCVNDPDMTAMGRWLYARHGPESLLGGKLMRVLPDLFSTQGIEEQAGPPYLRDVWLDGVQIMAARQEEGSSTGLYLAAKGGHNNESHNHNDVGQFIVYCEGEPVLIDPGVGTYTAKTFSDRRYEIWTMQSAYHNLPTVNGTQQAAGDEYAARGARHRAGADGAELNLNIAGAYPESAGIVSWHRTCRLVRQGSPCVEIMDDFALERASSDIALSLMTPCEPQVSSAGSIRLRAAGSTIRLTYDAGALRPEVEVIALDDERLRSSWGDRLFRIVLKSSGPVSQARWRLRLTCD